MTFIKFDPKREVVKKLNLTFIWKDAINFILALTISHMLEYFVLLTVRNFIFKNVLEFIKMKNLKFLDY